MCDQQGTDDRLHAWTARRELFPWRPPRLPQQPRKLCSALPEARVAAVTRPRGEDSEPGVHPPGGRHPCVPWAAGSQLQTVPSRHSCSAHARVQASEWVNEPSSRRRPGSPVSGVPSSRVTPRDGSFCLLCSECDQRPNSGRWKHYVQAWPTETAPPFLSPLQAERRGSENLKEGGAPKGWGLGP